MGKDSQSRKYQLTINSPLAKDLSHAVIKEKLKSLKSVVYWCMADEIGGKEKTHHTHCYLVASSAIRFSTIKNLFPVAHIELAKGLSQENRDYILKEGKWEKDAKNETKIEGTFEEFGDMPLERKGARNDLADLLDMVKSGMSDYEIISDNPNYILQIDKINRLRTIYLQEKYRGTRRLDLEVTYVYGETGCGKSRDILDAFGDECVYRITDSKNPFDMYNCEPVIVFEEFRSSFPLKDMLNLCDIYPITLSARYANKYACYTKVYICTNWALEKQYEEIQRADEESWNAFLRRIHRVNVYSSSGIVRYKSVDEYFKRHNVFTDLKKLAKEEQLEIPFS